MTTATVGDVRATDLPRLLERAAARVAPRMVTVSAVNQHGYTHTSGAGIALTSAGHILTAAHLLRDAASGGVCTMSRRAGGLRATVLATDPSVDAAILLTEPGPPLTPAALGDSAAVRVGEPVLVVGPTTARRRSFINGTVTSTYGWATYDEENPDAVYFPALCSDAATGPGSSGGAVVNLRGEVVGLHVAGRHGSDGHQSFAIPINDVRPLIARWCPVDRAAGLEARARSSRLHLPRAAPVPAADSPRLPVRARPGPSSAARPRTASAPTNPAAARGQSRSL